MTDDLPAPDEKEEGLKPISPAVPPVELISYVNRVAAAVQKRMLQLPLAIGKDLAETRVQTRRLFDELSQEIHDLE